MTNNLSARPKMDSSTRAIVAVLWILVDVFVIYPALRLLWVTFWVNGHFTPAIFAPLLTNWYGLPALYNSLLLGGAVGVTGTFVGFTFAHAVTRLSLPQTFKFLLSGISMLPLISLPFTSSIALTLSLGPHGILLKLLGPQNFDFYGFWGTFISETLTYYPIAF